MSHAFTAVPNDWGITRLDRVATVNARIGWKALTAAEYQSSGYAFLATPNIKAKEIDFDHVNYISDYRYQESPELQLAEGDVLLAKDGNTLGIVNVVRHLPRPATVNGSIAVIRPRGIDSVFLHYVIASGATQASIDAVKDGMGVPHLFQWDIKRLTVPLPPLDEQRRIADFLDAETARIDQMESLTDRQFAILNEWFTERMRSATTVKSGRVKHTGIDWMPEVDSDWPLVKVGYVFLTGSGTTPSSSDQRYFGGNFPWVNSADIRDGQITSTENTVTDRALADYSVLRIFPQGTLVIALYGQGTTKGRVGVLNIPACLNQACCALQPLGTVNTKFAYYWFRAHKDGIVGLAHGAGQPNLSQALIRQLKIPLPPIAEQVSIAEDLQSAEETMLRRQDLLEARVALLRERREALITAAVTGKFDVSSANGRGMVEWTSG